MKNLEKPDSVHLSQLIRDLRNGVHVIPDFQREFEWKPSDVLDLIKSIFADYYIGTLLFWEGNENNFKTLSCESIYGYKGKGEPARIVLDGQQRLTALYYVFFAPEENFRGRKSRYLYFINVQELLDNNHEEAFYYSYYKKDEELLEDPEAQYENHIYPLSYISKKGRDRYDWFDEYEEYWEAKVEELKEKSPSKKDEIKTYKEYAESGDEFADFIEGFLQEYYISYIELGEDIELGKVCDIFTQINSKGVRLDIFDLLNAILRPKEINLKERWRSVKPRLSFVDPGKMKIYVLQVMSILKQAYCSPKYLYYLVPNSEKTIKLPDGSKEEITLVKSEEEFRQKWDEAVHHIEKAIKTLKNPRDFGAIQSNYLPYPSILPAFAAIKAYVKSDAVTDKLGAKSKIRKWYWASVFLNRYSSAADSTSAKDYQDLKKWFEDDKHEPEYIKEFTRDYRNIDLISEDKKRSAVYKAIFNLLILKGASDWETFDLPEYDSLDDHHIVPSSLFKDEVGSKINTILNRTPLSEKTNRNIINNRMPNDYLKEMMQNNGEEQFYKVLESHLISRKAANILLRKPFTADDYDKFILERKKSILSAIENYCIEELTDVPPVLRELDEEIEQVELMLRDLITDEFESSELREKNFLPGHLIPKINDRIKKEVSQKPNYKTEDFQSIGDQVQFLDFPDYSQVITKKSNWQIFEDNFTNKSELQNRINKLSNLRNRIRHSREISETDRLDGQAAISWFKNTMN